jgi:very-long-chain enoyl-CoA reductase
MIVALFTVVGAVQMYFWAFKKHKRYIKEFGSRYPRGRKVLIPFVL